MVSEKRLIDVGELDLPRYKETGDPFIDGFHQGKIDAILEVMTLTPTVDVVEVVHGRWVSKERKPHLIYYCSECGSTWGYGAMLHMNYCPNCGAKMDLKE